MLTFDYQAAHSAEKQILLSILAKSAKSLYFNRSEFKHQAIYKTRGLNLSSVNVRSCPKDFPWNNFNSINFYSYFEVDLFIIILFNKQGT